jgi:periplasmic divalent cation tolerance protein
MGEGGGGDNFHLTPAREQVCSFVYVTCGSTEEAKRIGRTLVEQRLAACANVLPGMASCYRWQGRVEEASEAVLILKTSKEKAPGVIARAAELHSYSVPCAVELPVMSGNPAYIDWILAETA